MEKEIPETECQVGVLGANSPVGMFLLEELAGAGFNVAAFSRRPPQSAGSRVQWRNISVLESSNSPAFCFQIPLWVSLMPIWLLPERFDLLRDAGIRRLVVLGSTSSITKKGSSCARERALARRLADAEGSVLEWAEKNRIRAVLLLPTLIYGNGQDANVAAIAAFVRRFGFFPVAGEARGLRQPVHAQDVARACHAALVRPELKNSYILSGGESLPYREMVRRVFLAANRPSRILRLPLWLFRIAALVGRCLGMDIPTGAGERMNQDLVFEHGDATIDLNFRPRKFILSGVDVSSMPKKLIDRTQKVG